MGDLFGNDALFIDFDKQPSGAGAQSTNEVIDLTKDDASQASSSKSTKAEKPKEVRNLQSDTFFVDRGSMKMPSDWPLVSSLAALGDRPNYSSTFRNALSLPEPEEDKPPQRPSRPRMTCFNCGGPHMLSACKEPKDFAKIAQRRREFNDANPQANRPAPPAQQQPESLYPTGDLTSVAGQIPPLVSFEQFKPGTISHLLRQALGLYPNQIPPYVYFLREYGYPPGWLEEAKVPLGQGEISDVPLFDPKLIVEYPGYNAEMPPETVDETRHFRVRRLDTNHSAKAMRHWMEALKKHHTQRRALLASRKFEPSASTSAPKPEASASQSTVGGGGEAAMDLEDSSGDEAAIFTPTFDASKVTTSQVSLSSNENSNSSTEAADVESLEQEREKLLRLLESTLSGNAAVIEEVDEEGTSGSNNEETPATPGEEMAIPEVMKLPPKLLMSQSLGVSSGTPLPASMEVTVVPCREKFAAGIGDHLPFQNLPEAVGTFERLKRVLSGIRKRTTAQAGEPTATASIPQPSSSSSSRTTNSSSRSRYDKPGDGGSSDRRSGHSRESSNSSKKDRRDRSSDHHQSSHRSHNSEPRSSSHRYRPY